MITTTSYVPSATVADVADLERDAVRDPRGPAFRRASSIEDSSRS